MQALSKFVRYTPDMAVEEASDKAALAEQIFSMTGMPVIFLRDESGNDWYECQKKFCPETLKIAFDDDGLIRQFSMDVTTIMPEGLSVRELKATSLPQGLDVDGRWKFAKGKITRVELTRQQLSAAAEQEKLSRLQSVSLLIDPLSDAVELGRASEAQKAQLLAFRNYRVDLLNVNCDEPLSVVWPEVPENVA